jgi:hypothetical protein
MRPRGVVNNWLKVTAIFRYSLSQLAHGLRDGVEVFAFVRPAIGRKTYVVDGIFSFGRRVSSLTFIETLWTEGGGQGRLFA